MNFKTILAIGVLILDTTILLIIMGLMGIKNFASFSLYYIIGIIATALLIGYFTDGLNPKRWEEYANTHLNRWIKTFYVAGIILIGLIAAYIFKMPKLCGLITGVAVDIYMIYFFQEMLHILTQFTDMAKGMMGGIKWLK